MSVGATFKSGHRHWNGKPIEGIVRAFAWSEQEHAFVVLVEICGRVVHVTVDDGDVIGSTP